ESETDERAQVCVVLADEDRFGGGLGLSAHDDEGEASVLTGCLVLRLTATRPKLGKWPSGRSSGSAARDGARKRRGGCSPTSSALPASPPQGCASCLRRAATRPPPCCGSTGCCPRTCRRRTFRSSRGRPATC